MCTFVRQQFSFVEFSKEKVITEWKFQKIVHLRLVNIFIDFEAEQDWMGKRGQPYAILEINEKVSGFFIKFSDNYFWKIVQRTFSSNKPWTSHEKCSRGWLWRWSFNFPLSSPEGSIDLKFSLDKPGEIAIKRIPSIFSTNWRLRVFNFTASAKTEHARVLTCQKNNQPTKKERKGKNKHWNTILWHGSSIEKILVHRRMVERVRKKDDARHATRQENNRCVPA